MCLFRPIKITDTKHGIQRLQAMIHWTHDSESVIAKTWFPNTVAQNELQRTKSQVYLSGHQTNLLQWINKRLVVRVVIRRIRGRIL